MQTIPDSERRAPSHRNRRDKRQKKYHAAYSCCHLTSLLVRLSIISTQLSSLKSFSRRGPPELSGGATTTTAPSALSPAPFTDAVVLSLPLTLGEFSPVSGAVSPASSTCVLEMKSSKAAAFRFMSVM